MKDSTLHQIYARCEKNVRRETCSFEDLQISFWLVFHNSDIFSFIHKKRFNEKQKFNFLAEIYEIRKKSYETKLFISKRSTTLALNIFSYELYLLFINEKCYYKSFWFPKKLYDMQKTSNYKCRIEKTFSSVSKNHETRKFV